MLVLQVDKSLKIVARPFNHSAAFLLFNEATSLLFSFDKIISYVSKFVTLKVGDLIFTGTPEGVSAVHVGDKLQGYINGDLFLEFEVK